MSNEEKDLQAYLARIRKTIADSERVISQAELRMAETDRMLEQQGLTREQVMNFRFTQAQREAANEELRRRGLEPIDWEAEDAAIEPARAYGGGGSPDAADAATGSELAERQRKFGMMMKPFQI